VAGAGAEWVGAGAEVAGAGAEVAGAGAAVVGADGWEAQAGKSNAVTRIIESVIISQYLFSIIPSFLVSYISKKPFLRL